MVSLRLRLEATVMRSQSTKENKKHADLVEQLIGDEADDQNTHKPERTHDILNDLVLDRGPNPSTYSTAGCSFPRHIILSHGHSLLFQKQFSVLTRDQFCSNVVD